MGFLSGLFGQKKRTLKDLSETDLRREQITLENEMGRLESKAVRNDRDELQLKSEYAQATTATQKRLVARKIQNLRAARSGLETRMSYCQKTIRSIHGLMVIKENMSFFERVGVGSALVDMDISEVEAFIADATVEGTLQQEKLAVMLQQVEEGVAGIAESATDSSLDDIMAELDQETTEEKAVSETAPEGELAGLMTELDSAASKAAEAARRVQAEKQRQVNPPEEET